MRGKYFIRRVKKGARAFRDWRMGYAQEARMRRAAVPQPTLWTGISRPRSLDSRGMIRGMMPPEKTPKKSCVESSSDHSSLERDTLFQRGMIGRRLQVVFFCHFLGAIIPRSFREPDCKPGRHLTHLTGVFHPLGGAAFPLPNGKSGRFGACQG